MSPAKQKKVYTDNCIYGFVLPGFFASINMFFLLFTDGKDIMGIDAKEIGKRIKAVRKANGLTQQQFADMIGTMLNHVGKIEAGMKMASIDLLVVIAEKYDVTLDYLVLGR